MSTKELILVSDFDGVIGDSLSLALKSTRVVVDLFDKTEKINSFQDYYRLLGKNSSLKNINRDEAATLRELYRILIRHNSSEIGLFQKVINIYKRLKVRPYIVSSSYSDIIHSVLKDESSLFASILGLEKGHKRDILNGLKADINIIYVTDTFRDVRICNELQIPVIATIWGYDSLEKIVPDKPTYIAKNDGELLQLLTELKLLQ
jgi:phosphoglycolate phosphatase-like HAD superfamily hydrolase